MVFFFHFQQTILPSFSRNCLLDILPKAILFSARTTILFSRLVKTQIFIIRTIIVTILNYIYIWYVIKALRDLSRSESLKALQNTFITVKSIVTFLFDSQQTGLIQNEQNTAISKHFTKPVEYIHTCNQWNYFQCGCMDMRQSGDFSMYTFGF